MEKQENIIEPQQQINKQDPLFKLNKKYAQGIHTVLKHENAEFDKIFDISIENENQNIIVMHFGIGDANDYSTLKEFLNQYNQNYILTLFPGLPYAYLQYKQSPNELFNLLDRENTIQNSYFKQLPFLREGKHLTPRHAFFLKTLYSIDQIQSTKKNDIPNSQKNIQIPGLKIIENWISEQEEENLLIEIDKRPWQKLAKRKVQHYGFQFIYGTNIVDTKDLNTQEIPELFKDYSSKISNTLPNKQPFDQLTINNYYPGDQISSHYDSHFPFDEYLGIISLGGGVTMSFKNSQAVEKHLYIPGRSLIIFSDEVRYAWFHQIAARRIDKVENEILFRIRRVSLTFRQTKNTPCKCQWPIFCNSQTENPIQNKQVVNKMGSSKVVKEKTNEEKQIIQKNNNQTNKDLKPTELEQKYVYEVYEKIAPEFSHTRYKPWPKVANFLQNIEVGSLVADVGCGNGKYLGCYNHYQIIGTDRAANFMKICKEVNKNYQVFTADSLRLPLQSQKFDYAISIAVIHHFGTDELRKKAIGEIGRILRQGGKALIYVWAMEQKEKTFTEQDVFVPFHLHYKYDDEEVLTGDKQKNEDQFKKDSNYYQIHEQKKAVVYKRYYHVFVKGEIESYFKDIEELKIIESYYDHSNWCVIVQKQ